MTLTTEEKKRLNVLKSQAKNLDDSAKIVKTFKDKLRVLRDANFNFGPDRRRKEITNQMAEYWDSAINNVDRAIKSLYRLYNILSDKHVKIIGKTIVIETYPRTLKPFKIA